VNQKTYLSILAIGIALATIIVYSVWTSHQPLAVGTNNLRQIAIKSSDPTMPAPWRLVSQSEETRSAYFDDLNSAKWVTWEDAVTTDQADFFIAGVLTGAKEANSGSQDRPTSYQMTYSVLNKTADEKQIETAIN